MVRIQSGPLRNRPPLKARRFFLALNAPVVAPAGRKKSRTPEGSGVRLGGGGNEAWGEVAGLVGPSSSASGAFAVSCAFGGNPREVSLASGQATARRPPAGGSRPWEPTALPRLERRRCQRLAGPSSLHQNRSSGLKKALRHESSAVVAKEQSRRLPCFWAGGWRVVASMCSRWAGGC